MKEATAVGISLYHIAHIHRLRDLKAFTGLLKSRFQLSILACDHGRLRRPGRFFCSFCIFCLLEEKAKDAETAKENCAEAEPLHERDF